MMVELFTSNDKFYSDFIIIARTRNNVIISRCPWRYILRVHLRYKIVYFMITQTGTYSDNMDTYMMKRNYRSTELMTSNIKFWYNDHANSLTFMTIITNCKH